MTRPKSKSSLPPTLPAIDAACACPHCERAAQVLSTAHDSANALLKAYDLARLTRGRRGGMTTDNEQDLLRSMLVMAAAGLDATAKQLIQDALQHLLAVDDKARNSFEKFIQRRIVADASAPTSSGAVKLLAAALAAPSPQQRLIREYVQHLTEGSLQSIESLYDVAAALGVEPSLVGLDPAALGPVFDTRNKIIHELDINLDARTRTRNVRSQSTMMGYASRLFRLASALLRSVDQRLMRAS